MSGSDDTNINLWDVQTGGIIKTFCGHSDLVYHVSISVDHTMVASGSWDKTICLWDTQTGECCCIIDKHGGHISSVIFSPTNPHLLISTSSDQTVQQWDTEGHEVGPAYDGNYVAFSPDGTSFVLCGGGVTTIRNSSSGVVITTIHSNLQYCCFSSDGKFIAGTSVSTAYVWDITSSSPCLIEACVGHTGTITSLTFSSSLISSSNDKSIKFWQTCTQPTVSVITSLEHAPPTPASIVLVSLQAKDGIAISCDGAGVVRTWDILSGFRKASFHTPAGHLSRGDMKVVGNKLIVVWYTYNKPRGHRTQWLDIGKNIGKIHIWNTESGHHFQQAVNFQIRRLKISEDGSMVFFLGERHVEALSTWTGGFAGKVEFEDKLCNNFIVDGSRVWVQTRGSPIQGWDFGTPTSTSIPISDMPPDKPHLSFISGTKGQNTDLSRIMDTVTGEVVYRLPKRYGEWTVAQWDGQYLVTGYKSGEVMILDFGHMVPQ